MKLMHAGILLVLALSLATLGTAQSQNKTQSSNKSQPASKSQRLDNSRANLMMTRDFIVAGRRVLNRIIEMRYYDNAEPQAAAALEEAEVQRGNDADGKMILALFWFKTAAIDDRIDRLSAALCSQAGGSCHAPTEETVAAHARMYDTCHAEIADALNSGRVPKKFRCELNTTK